ncbi:MAG: DNA/RNA non-specific endonuclease [Bacteroidales bacterium]|nr:DNA/RNA non-specific endonuclease [Bacteroidales bacterium]
MRKSIILLAALLAAAGCERSEKPSPAPDGLVRISIDAVAAGIEGTRTGLDGLDVAWTSGDEVSVWDGSGNRYFTADGSGPVTTLSGDISSSASSFYALYPYDPDAVFTTTGAGVTVTAEVPTEQTATAGSFSDGNNISAAYSTLEGNFSFQNVLSVAKFTVSASELAGHGIMSVTLSSGNAIAGNAIVTISEEGSSAGAGSDTFKSIRLSSQDGTALTDGSYYITLLPNAGGQITLDFTAVDGYTASKTATLGKPFTAGTIKDLGTVKGLEWKAPMHVYTKVTTTPSDWSGQYLIVYEDGGKALDGSITEASAMNTKGNYKTVSISGSTISLSEAADNFHFTIAASGSAWTIKAVNGWYIGNTGTTNALTFSSSELTNTISVSGDGAVVQASGGNILRFNTSADMFRYYKSGQQAIELYRYSGTSSGSGDEEPPVEPGGGDTAGGYYELPVMNPKASGSYTVNADDPDQYYASHYFTMAGKTYHNYTVCFSADHHVPLWVAAPRHSIYSEKGTSRSDNYRADPQIPSSIQYSSTKTGGGCNKGHMLGSAERLCCSEANNQVFYYSNIAPQLSSGFNTGGGGWNTLEDFVDGFQCADTLYEVLGTYFEKYTDAYGFTVEPTTITFGGRSDVDMPTMFYYVLLRTKRGNSGIALKDCTADEIMCAAFVRAHSNSLKGQAVTSREMMSVADLEKVTGVNYFPNVPNAPKTSFKASDWGL